MVYAMLFGMIKQLNNGEDIMHNFIFGVFSSGKLVFAIGQPTICTHNQAAVVVGILNLANSALLPGHYFACDYWVNQWGNAEV